MIEQQIKQLLLKEAEVKREHDKQRSVHKFLLAEVLDEDSDAKAMARQSGGLALKHSGWNTDWEFKYPENKIKALVSQISAASSAFFRTLNQSGSSGDLRPADSVSFKFQYFRTIMPDNNKEANSKAVNALRALDALLPGFSKFAQDLEKLHIPLCPYFMTENFKEEEGRVDPKQLNAFIQSQAQSPLQASHFAPHMKRLKNNEPVNISGPRGVDRFYSMADINKVTDPKMLINAINYRIATGYSLTKNSYSKIQASILELYRKKKEEKKLDPQNPQHHKQLAELQAMLRQDIWDRIISWWQAGRPEEQKIPAHLLREILKNMDYIGGSGKEMPDQFVIPKQRSMYVSNGWDSSPNNPGKAMLVIPPLRSLPPTDKNPLGEVRSDRGNGNLSYDHLVLNWQNGLDRIFQTYGPQLDKWIQTLNNEQNIKTLEQTSPEAYMAWRLILSPTTGSRTSAENLVEVLKRWPDWNNFYKHHLQKSFYSEICAVNKLIKIQPADYAFNNKTSLLVQLQQQVDNISAVAQSDPVTANKLLNDRSVELVSFYKQGALSWDNLTLSLYILNQAAVKNKGLEGNRVGDRRGTIYKNRIDPQGFETLKQYGYQMAKMMDFLRAIMTRCCHEVIKTHSKGFEEHQFGHNYGTSSGVSEGGVIVLEVRYNELSARRNGEQIDVKENINFTLGQSAGKDEERQMIISRQSTSWETMLDLFMSMYPEAGYQFQEINEPVNRGLASLQSSVTKAISAANTSGFPIVYQTTEGNTITLDPPAIAPPPQPKQQPPKLPETPLGAPDQPIPDFVANPSPEEVEESVFGPGQTSASPTIPHTDKNITKGMPEDNSGQLMYLQKRRNNDRRLLRERPKKSGTPSHIGSIEEKLQKAANRLDEHGQQHIADKIDLLLQKICEAD